MKKIVLAMLLFWSQLAWADEYPSLHGGTFLNDILSSSIFLNNENFTKNYSFTISRHSAKSPTSGLPYYPQGWDKFKMYVPPGMRYCTIIFSTIPNGTLRVHTKFKGDTDNTINHYAPISAPSAIVTQTTVQGIILNTDRFFLGNTQEGGWLYFDIVEDSANSYAENTYGATNAISLLINYNLAKTDDTLFNNWLNSTYFLTPAGDPSALMQAMNIIDVTTQNVQTQRSIPLDYGGALYNGTPISSASSSSVSSVSSSTSSNSCPTGQHLSQDTGGCVNDSSSSSVVPPPPNSSSVSSNPCPSGQYLSQDTGGCVGSSSSVYIPSSSTSSIYTGSSSATCGILPGQTPCTTSSVASSGTSSSNPCGTGYHLSTDTGGCVANSFSSVSSSVKASSSSSVSDQNLTTRSLNLEYGWNIISIPAETNSTIDINQTLSNKATIGWKFQTLFNDTNDTLKDYAWEEWLPGTAMTLRSGEGMFVGVPTGAAVQPLSFNIKLGTSSAKFNEISFILNKWYLLGFGYDITVGSIKTQYPNSLIWVMENSAYKKLEDNATTITAGQGFWFKNKGL